MNTRVQPQVMPDRLPLSKEMPKVPDLFLSESQGRVKGNRQELLQDAARDFKSALRKKDEERAPSSFETNKSTERPSGLSRDNKNSTSTLTKDEKVKNTDRAYASKQAKQNDAAASEKGQTSEKIEGAEEIKDKGKGSVKKDKKSLAMLKFMDSIESELGIPPEKIVAGMANLNPSELQLNPFQTSDKVIGQLGLDEAGQLRAKELYTTMLLETEAKPEEVDGSLLAWPALVSAASQESAVSESSTSAMADRGPYLANQGLAMPNQAASDAGVLQGVSDFLGEGSSDAFDGSAENDVGTGGALESSPNQLIVKEAAPNKTGEVAKIDPKEFARLTSQERKAYLNASLDRLSDEFFVDNQKLKGQASFLPQMMPNAAPEGLSEMGLAKNPQAHNLALTGGLVLKPDTFSLASGYPGPIEDSTVSALSNNLGQEGNAFEVTTTDDLALRVAMLKDQEANGYLPNLNASEVGHSLADGQDSWALEQNKMPTELSGGIGEDIRLSAQDSQSDLGQASDEQLADGRDNPNAAAFGLNAATADKTKAMAGAGFFSVDGKRDLDQVNLDRIIEQSEFLVKKGGGTMKIKLFPEGMGQVELKVLVQDGRVNLSFAAESKEVQELLEKNMDDLKQSLSQQKLAVEQVKIDKIFGEGRSYLENQLDLSQQQSGREDARQFMNFFRENNSSQRNNFFDVPYFKNYQAQERDGLDIEKEVAGKKSKDGKGQGLNLVA